MLLGKCFTEVSGREEWVTLAFCGGHFYCILFVRFLICVNVPTRFLDMATSSCSLLMLSPASYVLDKSESLFLVLPSGSTCSSRTSIVHLVSLLVRISGEVIASVLSRSSYSCTCTSRGVTQSPTPTTGLFANQFSIS